MEGCRRWKKMKGSEREVKRIVICEEVRKQILVRK